ncbi:papilin [Drosophila rhopaloa]|uniref:BPTI/Kunitz inhibitor domain-containing protein n=1 Tax=Drosophila rhopaloa TaxID=1041015 RepID=A0ABM5I2P9_DRORH|nr:papilin [Drosophila rhopaloa]
MDQWTEVLLDEWTSEQGDRWTRGPMDTWMDWQKDWTTGHSIFQFELHFNQFGSVHFEVVVMWVTFLVLLCGFFCRTVECKRGTTPTIHVRRLTRIGGFDILQERCLFTPSYGTCKKFIKVFGYNLMTNRCTEYIYSGCGGNPNRFATDSQCRNTCFVVRKRVTVSEPDYYEDEDATEAIQIDKRKLSRLRGIGRING